MEKLKEAAWRVFEVLFFAVVALTVLGNLVNWLRGVDDGKPREGQLCGPAHHWIYVRSSIEDPDMSCEPDFSTPATAGEDREEHGSSKR